MPSDKTLLQQKLTKKPLKNVLPSKEEGRNGDLQLANISGKGQFLLGKINGEWFTNKLSSIRKMDTLDSKKIKTTSIHSRRSKLITLTTESITTNIYSGKTATPSATSRPLLKIGANVTK